MPTPIPGNRANFTVDDVVAATGALTTAAMVDECSGVVTDSRAEVAGKLFVALPGEKFDGHGYVAEVLERGAWGAIIERAVPGVTSERVMRVASTLRALGALARFHRSRWGRAVVTVGGSAGKTTTRSAISAMLEAVRPGKIHSTEGNLNNLVGVPMTLLGIEPRHEIAVVEVGTNQRGEVSQLAAVCQADVAVLTCIGLEHSAGLGDLEGVEQEERDIFSSMRWPGHVVGSHDDERVLRLLQGRSGAKIWSYGEGVGATHRILSRTALDASRSRLRILRKLGERAIETSLVTRLVGLPGALGTSAALAVADALFESLDADCVGAALDREVGEAGRLRIVERSDRALVVDDCYNANPISMRSSIAVAKELASTRRARLCLVLGDMLELGELSRREHAALAGEIAGADAVIAVGPEMVVLVEQAAKSGLIISHFGTSAEAATPARDAVCPGDVVLVKGSRGMKLERIVDAVLGGGGTTP